MSIISSGSIINSSDVLSYFNCRMNGSPAPHMLTADEACEQFNLSLSELLWLCFDGMRFYDLHNPTDVHPETIPTLDPNGLIKDKPLVRRVGFWIQLGWLQKPLSEFKLDTVRGHFWRYWWQERSALPTYLPQLPDGVIFSLKESGTWQFSLSGKYLTGLAFIAEDLEHISGLLTYSYGPGDGEYELNLSIYVGLSSTVFAFVTVEGQHYFPFDRDIMSLASRMGPGVLEMEKVRIPILEGFCLHYLIFSGFSFREMIAANSKIAKDIAAKIRGFRSYFRYFFLFGPEDISAAIKEKMPISAAMYNYQRKWRGELESLKNIALDPEYQAQRWRECKEKMSEKDKKLAETAALLFEGEQSKLIEEKIWPEKSERLGKYIYELRPKMAALAKKYGLRMPPKSTRGAKKKRE